MAAYLVSIMRYLHRRGIIIRNLRPETIIFQDKDVLDIKIVDLTLAVNLENIGENKKDPIFHAFQRYHPAFTPPELFMVKKNYSYEVDVWSLGCLIFNMVTGIPPFYESDISALKNSIQHGEYRGYFPEFDKNASQQLQDLMAKMIHLDQSKRIASDELIHNEWINCSHQRYKNLNPEAIQMAFLNMKNFRIAFELQRVAMIFMAKTMISKREKEVLRTIFDAIDQEKDGEIELDELVEQMDEKFGMKVERKEMEKIMISCDLDYDGKMQFTEFLMASCNKHSLFSEGNMKECFNHIDYD